MIKNQTGELVTNKWEVAEEFKIYFDKLLNNTTTRTNEHTKIQYSSVEPYISSPSRSEINAAINKLKNNKAPGEDHIVAELVKNSGEAVKNEVWKLINIIWEKQQMPEEWNTAIICPIFKKGNILETKLPRNLPFRYLLQNTIFNPVREVSSLCRRNRWKIPMWFQKR